MAWLLQADDADFVSNGIMSTEELALAKHGKSQTDPTVPPNLKRWHDRVKAAEKAVAEAEAKLSTARTPQERTWAFRDLEEKTRQLRLAQNACV